MSDLKEYLDKQLSNPEFAIEYKKQRSEYEIVREEIRVQANGNIHPLKSQDEFVSALCYRRALFLCPESIT